MVVDHYLHLAKLWSLGIKIWGYMSESGYTEFDYMEDWEMSLYTHYRFKLSFVVSGTQKLVDPRTVQEETVSRFWPIAPRLTLTQNPPLTAVGTLHPRGTTAPGAAGPGATSRAQPGTRGRERRPASQRKGSSTPEISSPSCFPLFLVNSLKAKGMGFGAFGFLSSVYRTRKTPEAA